MAITVNVLALIFAVAASMAVAADDRGGLKVVSPKGEFLGTYAESHALVIGVSEYENWRKLPGVKSDVIAVAQTFRNLGFTVQTLEDPDKDRLEKAVTTFIATNGRGKDNRLIIYFAGHGYTETPSWGGDPMGYIVPVDAPVPQEDPGGFQQKSITMKRFEEYALTIQSKHALFIFDSCFSGSVFSTFRDAPAYISNKTLRPVRQFLTAGTSDQRVPDQSIFRTQLVTGLKGAADVNNDRYITATELYQYLDRTVTEFTDSAQTPQLGVIRNQQLVDGDFVFGLEGPSAPPVVEADEVFQANRFVGADSPELNGFEVEKYLSSKYVKSYDDECQGWRVESHHADYDGFIYCMTINTVDFLLSPAKQRLYLTLSGKRIRTADTEYLPYRMDSETSNAYGTIIMEKSSDGVVVLAEQALIDVTSYEEIDWKLLHLGKGNLWGWSALQQYSIGYGVWSSYYKILFPRQDKFVNTSIYAGGSDFNTWGEENANGVTEIQSSLIVDDSYPNATMYPLKVTGFGRVRGKTVAPTSWLARFDPESQYYEMTEDFLFGTEDFW